MKIAMKPYTTIDEYIVNFPRDTQAVLQTIRKVIHATAPEAQETISYGIPTFDFAGKHLVHFAGNVHHIGFYPTPESISVFAHELADYVCSKGAIQFPLGKPIPMDLIRQIVEHRMSVLTKVV
jgi:uncharacterized protein YdhG (YjbR/CyaY superfamily)